MPVAVFVTFADEDGVNIAVDYNKIPQMKLLGEDIEVTQAPEPTDIIWENRQYHPAERKLRSICSWIIILILLFISLITIFTFSSIGTATKNLFP
jgi:hypothetical protein